MPSINIYERDLTTVSSESLTTNIAYVPGYAITGPVNTPTLCKTLEQFQETFGYLPYRFQSKQDYPMATDSVEGFDTNAMVSGLTTFALADSFEQSYIYAADLLNNGLPIIYERVMNSTNIETLTASAKIEDATDADKYIEIKAKYPGKYGELISYSLTKTNDVYSIEVKLNKDTTLGINNDVIVDNIYFNTDATSSYYWENIESDIFDLTVTGDVALTDTKSDNLKLGDSPPDEFTIAYLYSKMNESEDDSLFNKLVDRNEYQIKFITSGAYPTFEYDTTSSETNSIVYNMMKVAANRGDAIALIDHVNNTNRKLVSTTSSLYERVQNLSVVYSDTAMKEDVRKYGAMFACWATYYSKTLNGNYILPASFGYLSSLAESVKTNENYYAVAGVTRGLVPNLIQTSQNITGAIAEAIQEESRISINPITNVKPYGYCIWGNRTLFESTGLVASSFLNIRMLSSDVKKVVYTTAKAMTFELNTDVLWLNFKAAIEPTLDKMVTSNGLTGYKIIKKTSTKRATIEAVIRLFVVEAVENWDITIELSDSTVSVE